MESEFTMFRTSIADAAPKSCGLKDVCACCGGNQRTSAVRKAIKLRKETFRTWLSRGSPEASDRYRVARRAAALLVAKTGEDKTLAKKEFGEKDFRLASRMFWQTIW